MSLNEQINADFITAFKAKEMDKKNFLGLLKGEIKNEESRPNSVASDDLTMGVLKRMEKSLKLADTAQNLEELTYLGAYLPVMKTEAELTEIILGYKEQGVSNMGQLMGRINKEYKWAIDNTIVTRIAPTLLK